MDHDEVSSSQAALRRASLPVDSDLFLTQQSTNERERHATERRLHPSIQAPTFVDASDLELVSHFPAFAPDQSV
jgi:hypothetical protein